MEKGPQRLNGLHEFRQQGGPVGTGLGVEQFLSEDRIVDGGDEVAMPLTRDAAFFEFACQPQAAVEADPDGEREPSLDADVAESEAVVEKVVVQMETARRFLAGFDEAIIGLTQAVGHRHFHAGEQGDASVAAVVGARQPQRDHVFLDLGTVEVQQRNAFAGGLGVGLFTQVACQFFAVLGKVTAQDAALVHIAVDTADMIEQARFAPEAQPIKTRENETDQGVKTG